jgi:hypothetical protein
LSPQRRHAVVLRQEDVVAEPSEVEDVGQVGKDIVAEERRTRMEATPGQIARRRRRQLGMQKLGELPESACNADLVIGIHHGLALPCSIVCSWNVSLETAKLNLIASDLLELGAPLGCRTWERLGWVDLFEIAPDGWNLADRRAVFEHVRNDAAPINGAISVAMLLSRRRIGGNERNMHTRRAIGDESPMGAFVQSDVGSLALVKKTL